MALRDVAVTEIREVLSVWLSGCGPCGGASAQAGVDRRTARRCVDAAVGAGLTRGGWTDAARVLILTGPIFSAEATLACAQLRL